MFRKIFGFMKDEIMDSEIWEAVKAWPMHTMVMSKTLERCSPQRSSRRYEGNSNIGLSEIGYEHVR
jgi:hypothetical protein